MGKSKKACLTVQPNNKSKVKNQEDVNKYKSAKKLQAKKPNFVKGKVCTKKILKRQKRLEKLAVVPLNYPYVKLTRELTECFSHILQGQFDSLTDKDVQPNFISWNRINGYLVVEMCDKQTNTWLQTAVKKCVKDARWISVQGPGLYVTDYNNVKLTQVKLFVSGCADDAPIVLRRFMVQNKELNSRHWEVVSFKRVDGGSNCVLTMMSDSVKKLKNRAYVVYYGLGKINAVI